MKYTQVRNPQWANPENTLITCEVIFPDLDANFLPFGAVASGDAEHTHEIFARCLSGEFGEIAAYVPPPVILGEAALTKVRAKRDELLTTEVDPLVSNPLRWNELSPEKQEEWAAYRRALLDISTVYPEPKYLWDATTKAYLEVDVVFPSKPL